MTCPPRCGSGGVHGRCAARPGRASQRPLEKIDDQLGDLHRKHGEAVARLQAADAALEGTPQHDAATLAQWIQAGERGDPPEPTLQPDAGRVTPPRSSSPAFRRHRSNTLEARHRDAIARLNELADEHATMVIGVRHLSEKEITAGV
jgi:hypothetical protein